jgi:GT2 family glycosyltransferase
LMSNSGPARARNVGFDHAVGDFVVFLDSDDVLTRGALETAARAFEAIPSLQFLTLEGESRALDRCDANHRIVRSQCPGWNGEGFDAERLAATTLPATTEDGDRTRLSAGDFLSAILFGDLFYLSGLVMRRAAARIAGPFNERFFYLEDWEFAARLCLTGAGGYVDEVGFHRECGRVDQLSLRGNAWRRAAMHLHVLNAIEAACERIGCALPVALRRARGSALYAFARCLNERGRVGRARDYFVRALLLDYKPHKCAVWLLHGFAPQRLRVWFLRRFEWASGR